MDDTDMLHLIKVKKKKNNKELSGLNLFDLRVT